MKLSVEDDPGKDSNDVTDALRRAVAVELGLPADARREDGSPLLRDGETYGVRVVRKSCDARKIPPVFNYVVDVDDSAINSATVAMGSIKPLKVKTRAKVCERAPAEETSSSPFGLRTSAAEGVLYAVAAPPKSLGAVGAPPVVVVGLGPAGLFAALALAETGANVVVLERGQPV